MSFTDPNVKRLLPGYQAPSRLPGGAFAPGNTLGAKGRPKGAKHKLSEKFISDVAKHWETHGELALNRMAKEKPADYVKVVAGLVPKDLNLDASEDIKQYMDMVASGGKLIQDADGTYVLEIDGEVAVEDPPAASLPPPVESEADRIRRALRE